MPWAIACKAEREKSLVTETAACILGHLSGSRILQQVHGPRLKTSIMDTEGGEAIRHGCSLFKWLPEMQHGKSISGFKENPL